MSYLNITLSYIFTVLPFLKYFLFWFFHLFLVCFVLLFEDGAINGGFCGLDIAKRINCEFEFLCTHGCSSKEIWSVGLWSQSMCDCCFGVLSCFFSSWSCFFIGYKSSKQTWCLTIEIGWLKAPIYVTGQRGRTGISVMLNLFVRGRRKLNIWLTSQATSHYAVWIISINWYSITFIPIS